MYRRLYRGWMMSFFKQGKSNMPFNKTPLVHSNNNNDKIRRNDNYKKYDNTRYTKDIKTSNKINLQLQQSQQVDRLNDQLRTQKISHQDPFQEQQIDFIYEEQQEKKVTKFEQTTVMKQKNQEHQQKLLKLLDYTQNKDIKRIVGKLLSKSNEDIHKASRELFTALDFEYKNNYNTFQCALFIIGLYNSNNNYISYKERSFILFISIYNMETYMFYTRQGHNSIEIKPPIHRDMKKQDKDLIFNEILKHFPSFYMLIRSRHEKNKHKCGLFNILTQLQGQTLTFETINRILDVLVLLLFQQDNQIDKFKATRIFNNVISNFIANVESNPDIVKNLNLTFLNLRQFQKMNIHRYYQMLNQQRKSKDSQSMIHLIVKIVKVSNMVSCYQLEDKRKLLNIILSDNLYVNSPNFVLFKFYSMMAKIFTTEIDQNGNNPIIQKIKRLSLTNLEKKQNFKASYIHDNGFFFNLVRSKFYRHYITLKSETIEGHIVIKQKPTIPPLDDFEIKYYKQYEPQIIKYELTKFIMNYYYPELVTKKELNEQKPSERIRILKDNQIVGRLGQAISKLNIQYQKQMKVLGNRSVDFLLKNNIIIQCDGDIHIDFSTLNVTCSTAFRNLSLMLSGYRIIVICMSEINENRGPQSLEELLKKKLRILQETNAYLVQ